MSEDHKAALAAGRNQGRSVRRYLEALDRHRPKRGRKRTRDSIHRRLERIEEELAGAGPLQRLHLTQERLDLRSELEAMEATVDLNGLEAEFVQAAGPYSERKGISWNAWRQLGVDPNVLRRAGIPRGRP
jgi:hypothetical protein